MSEFVVNGPSADGLDEVERHFGCALPSRYRDFMAASNGGEGFVGEEYVRLWRVNQLVEFNGKYEVAVYAPGLLLIGSNGGGEAFAFDLRDPRLPVVLVPFIGMELASAIRVADSFDDFFSEVAHGVLG